MKNLKYITYLIFIVCFSGCEPSIEEKSTLGELPNPSFTISQGEDANTFILTNTTEGAFLTNWVMENNGEESGEVVEVVYPIKGTYDVTMTTFNAGGSASLTQQVVVENDGSGECFGNLELLTACTEKVWKIASETHALHIGPNIEETWWGNDEGVINERTCHWDDEYIFRRDGSFEYDNKGDFWADADDANNVWPSDLGLTVGCHAGTEWPDKYAAWDSGEHQFSITQDKLTVIGEGAWIGLYKIGTSDEVDTPQSSVTFSIDSITEDRMVIFADYGWAVWRVTLTAQ